MYWSGLEWFNKRSAYAEKPPPPLIEEASFLNKHMFRRE
jgi:hypothetical protein